MIAPTDRGKIHALNSTSGRRLKTNSVLPPSHERTLSGCTRVKVGSERLSETADSQNFTISRAKGHIDAAESFQNTSLSHNCPGQGEPLASTTQIAGQQPCAPCPTNHGRSFSQTNKSKWSELWSRHLREANNGVGGERGREQQAFSLRHNNGLCKHLLHQYLARRHSLSPQNSLFTF